MLWQSMPSTRNDWRETESPLRKKKLLDEIRRPREAGGIVAEIPLFERERFRDLEEAPLEIDGESGREFFHGEKYIW